MAQFATIPRYTSKDIPILVMTMLPMSIVLNYILYGDRLFSGLPIFTATTLVSFILLAGAFVSYGLIAIYLRNRFPSDSDLAKRIAICLSIFFVLTLVFMSLVLRSYDLFHFFGYDFSDQDFFKAYLAFITMNIFLTFLNEGVYRFERYKAITTETEQLKKEYMQSQLLGLKSQMNPHFLFNSLNSLSSLIQDDDDKAEEFLDHMSIVYRYLLRNNEETLVSLQTELNFIRSYKYLLTARYGDGLRIDVHIDDLLLEKQIPPLTLQMLIENALNNNTVSKSEPLHILIRSDRGRLEIVNNVQLKKYNEQTDEGIENIANKFKLICQKNILVNSNDKERIIRVPLLPEKMRVL